MSISEEQSRLEPKASLCEQNGTGVMHNGEDDIPPVFRDKSNLISDEDLSEEDQMIRRVGTLALEGLIELTTDHDGWNLKTVDDIKCYTKYINGRKVVKMESIVEVSAQQLWAILYPGEITPEWNKQCEVNKSLHQVDRTTDVVYTISKAVGPLSARDFVSSRRIAHRDGAYYLCCKSIVTDLMPEQSGNVRGENGPCGYKVIPIDSNSCHFIWVYNSAIKGWLPQVVVDQAASSALIAAFQQLLKGENGPCGYKVIPNDSNSCQFIWVYNSAIKGWLPQVVVDQAASSALIAAFQQLLKYVKTGNS